MQSTGINKTVNNITLISTSVFVKVFFDKFINFVISRNWEQWIFHKISFLLEYIMERASEHITLVCTGDA